MRYTIKDAEKAAARLAEMCGRPVAVYTVRDDGHAHTTVGAVGLDNGPGGVEPFTIANEGGGHSMPFDYGRMTPREFCRAVQIAAGALRLVKENQDA